MSQTTTREKNEKAEPLTNETPHPLASLIGAWKDTEKLKTLMERVEAYRHEVEVKERGAKG
ncbi:hypothetical protein [Armatimonas sp.]|uniref:hypothetical protein n=1 Tax=Armatimonas sp. TaxID=1872638 RepID=UPI00374D1322